MSKAKRALLLFLCSILLVIPRGALGHGDGEEDSNQGESDYHGHYGGSCDEACRANWRASHPDWAARVAAWKASHASGTGDGVGATVDGCQRGIYDTKAKINELADKVNSANQQQILSIDKAKEQVVKGSDVSGATPEVKRDAAFVGAIEEKILRGQPVTPKDIAPISNPQVRLDLQAAAAAQEAARKFEQERKKHETTIKKLEEVIVAIDKGKADLSSLGQANSPARAKPTLAGRHTLSKVARGEPKAASVRAVESEPAAPAEPIFATFESKRQYLQAMRKKMLTRVPVEEGLSRENAEELFAGNLAPFARDPEITAEYVAFTGENRAPASTTQAIAEGLFEPLKNGATLSSPENDAEVARIAASLDGNQAERDYQAGILFADSKDLFHRVRRSLEACTRRNCVASALRDR